MLVVYAAAALAVALIGARYIKSAAAQQTAGSPAASQPWSRGPAGDSAGAGAAGVSGGTGAVGETRKFAALVVHVAGEVRRPGVVRLRDGDRVGDAISAAGGATGRADLDAVNLALRLADGQQVIVPRRGGAAAGGASGAAGPAGPVSLSSATAAQLDELDGVGPGLAAKIIAYRTEHGGFRSVDELAEVPGIGEKRLESLRSQLQP